MELVKSKLLTSHACASSRCLTKIPIELRHAYHMLHVYCHNIGKKYFIFIYPPFSLIEYKAPVVYFKTYLLIICKRPWSIIIFFSLSWTRQEAIDYMQKYTANGESDIRTEIDRYITWPGQACSYKIGELKIRELRNRAAKELGQ